MIGRSVRLVPFRVLCSLVLWGVGSLLGLAACAQQSAPASPAASQDSLFATYAAFRDSLDALAAVPEQARRDSLVGVLWAKLRAAEQVPFARGEQVAFLYRGAAREVLWNGDFNGWGGDRSVRNRGERLPGTDLWILEHTFPADARLDYKIVTDGTWRLDPANPHQQLSGFGPNSELRMPAYEPPPETERLPDVPRGTLTSRTTLASDTLGYEVAYRVYTPAGYAGAGDELDDLPALYVTDGHEYANERMGSLTVVLDNLIGKGVIEPVLAVFIDPRDPATGTNRRESQYAADYTPFGAFLADELVPHVDSTYRTDASAGARGILGTSLGGVFSAFVGLEHPDVFSRIGIHSPAFWYDTERNRDAIYQRYEAADTLPLDIFMSTGTIYDTQDGARRMRDLLQAKGYALNYVEVNEGHSWGNWRALLDEPLMQWWGTGTGLSADEPPAPRRDAIALTTFPNPFATSAQVAFELLDPGETAVYVYDLLGRRVATLLPATWLPAGPHRIAWSAADLASGVYLVRLTGNGMAATTRAVRLP